VINIGQREHSSSTFTLGLYEVLEAFIRWISNISGGMTEKSSVEARLGVDKWELDRQSHIRIADQELCRRCVKKPCLTVCPAKVYRWENNTITLNYAACLELRACYVACHEYGKGAIEWEYPNGGKGVVFRYG
jgi:ferredoxin like protein